MSRYQFIVGVSLTDLEKQLNQTVSNEPCLDLKQIMYVQGTGYVAVVERSNFAEPNLSESDESVKKTRRSPQKAHQNSLEEIQKKNS